MKMWIMRMESYGGMMIERILLWMRFMMTHFYHIIL